MVARRIEESLKEEERASFSEGMAALQRTQSWLDEHYDALLREHPDRWVAVSSEGVVDADKSFDALVGRIDAMSVRDGRLIVEYLPSKPLNMIL